MIILRDFYESDIPGISEIHERQPNLGVPSLDHVFINKTIEQDGKILGYGVVKQFAEAVLILDHSLDKRTKAEAVKQSMRIAIHGAEMLNLEQLYITTPYEGFSKVIQKHYNFVECPNTFYLLNLGK